MASAPCRTRSSREAEALAAPDPPRQLERRRGEDDGRASDRRGGPANPRWHLGSNEWRSTYKHYIDFDHSMNWAWHDYPDINGDNPHDRATEPDEHGVYMNTDTERPWIKGGSTVGISNFLKAIPAQAKLWLTEQGPIVWKGGDLHR